MGPTGRGTGRPMRRRRPDPAPPRRLKPLWGRWGILVSEGLPRRTLRYQETSKGTVCERTAAPRQKGSRRCGDSSRCPPVGPCSEHVPLSSPSWGLNCRCLNKQRAILPSPSCLIFQCFSHWGSSKCSGEILLVHIPLFVSFFPAARAGSASGPDGAPAGTRRTQARGPRWSPL